MAGAALRRATAAPSPRQSALAQIAPWVSRGFARIDAAMAHTLMWWSAAAAIVVLQSVLIVRHQPWSDEWQALQIAVELPTLHDFLVNLRYEGHPPLWYALLRGLAAVLPDPALALPGAALLIALPTQAAILLCAPFRRIDRLMLASSEFILFEAMTLSRSLTLGVALMIAVAALWRRPRLIWIALALLPLCDALFAVASVLLVAVRWIEARGRWGGLIPGTLVWAACGAIAAWTVRPMPDVVPALVPTGTFHDGAIWLTNFSANGLPLQWSMLHPVWNNPPPPLLGSIAVLGFVLMVRAELGHDRKRLVAWLALVGFTLGFSLEVYHLSIRHLQIAALMLIALVWQRAAQGHAPGLGWRAWIAVSGLCGLFTAAVNLVEPFDTAPQALGAITRLGLADKAWVAFPANAGQSVSALGNIRFERLAEHCTQDFVRWNDPDIHRIDSYRAIETRLADKLAADGRFWLISRFELPDHPPLLHRIATIAPGYDGQAFNLYAVGDQGRPARPHTTACNGNHTDMYHAHS